MPVNETIIKPDDGDDDARSTNPMEIDVDETAEPRVRHESDSDEPA